MLKTLMIFTQPKEANGYKGGIATLCNDYVDSSEIFLSNSVALSYDNYHPDRNRLLDTIRISKFQNLVYGFRQYNHLKKLLAEEKFDVIHVHTSRRWLFMKDIVLLDKLRKHYNGKIDVTIHVGDIKTVFAGEKIKNYLLKLINRSVDKVIFLSEAMRKSFVSAGLNEEKTHTLYNFYNIPQSEPHRVSSIPQIVFLGSINRDKGIYELMEATATVKHPFHLHICGTILEEEIRKPFEEFVNAHKEKVTFHGYIGKEEKIKLLKQADILALPSYREGLPVSILEAMANGCAIITTPVGAIPEILTAANAEIIPSRSAVELTVAMEKLLSSPELMSRMTQQNFSDSSKYSKTTHIADLCRLYQS